MSGTSDGHGQPTSYGTGGRSTLSNKAKGKQRAANQDDPESQTSSLGGLELGFRFTDGVTEDLEIFVNASEPVRDVKRRVSIVYQVCCVCCAEYRVPDTTAPACIGNKQTEADLPGTHYHRWNTSGAMAQ